MYQTEIRKQYTMALSKQMGNRSVFLLSSGTEATECAIRLMRKNGIVKNPEKKKIVSFSGAMHGRTMAAELSKGTDFWESDDFIVLDKHAWEPDFNWDKITQKLDELYPNQIAGIMIEAFEGWSCNCINGPTQKKIRKWATDRDILVCLDDIQAGVNRCFSFTTATSINSNLFPDLICLGKGLGGGFPISAVCGKDNIMNVFKSGEMSSTHSANPIVCAAGLAILKESIRHHETVISNTIDFDIEINRLQRDYPNIKINKIGMIASLIFDSEQTATQVVKLCYKQGLLVVHTGRESVKIGPPLTIKVKNLKRGMEILRSVLDVFA